MVTRHLFRTSLLALLSAAFLPGLYANSADDNVRIADARFSSSFELFYMGPQWFRNALPSSIARARSMDMTYDRSGDRTTYEAAYVGTLRDEPVGNMFGDMRAFNRTASYAGLLVPLAPDATNATKYWDVSAGLGNGVGGSGTWTLQTDLRWSDSPTGDAAPLKAAAATDAGIFEGTAGTVSIAGDLSLASWTFNTTNYVLTPNSGTARTLTGSFVLGAGVNLNIGDAAGTTDRTLSLVGPGVTGGAGSGLTLQGAQTNTDGRGVRIQLSQASASIDLPITISGAGTTAAGVIGNATGTGVTGTITNNSGFRTLLGATSGNDLTLSSTAVISGTAGLRIGLNASTSDNVGTVILNAANTYTGGTELDGGTLVLGSDTALGTNTLTLSNSTTSVLQAGGGARTLANNIVWGGNGTLSGGNAFTFNGTFTSSGAASRSITVNNTGGLDINGNVFLAESETARGLTIGGTSNTTIDGVIANNNAGNTVASTLGKTGSGLLTLTNANTYTGNTSVSGGTLLVVNTTGSGTGTGAVTVTNVGTTLAGGTTAGTGGIAGPVTVNSGANLSPGTAGNGAGTTAILNTGALTLASGSNFNVDLNGLTAGTGYDQVSLTGTGSIALSNLGVTVGSTFALGDKFFIVLNDGTDPITGTFAQGGTVTANNGYTFLIDYLDNGDAGGIGNDISLTLVAVPEPGTWIGAALALAAIGFTQRRRLRGLIARA